VLQFTPPNHGIAFSATQCTKTGSGLKIPTQVGTGQDRDWKFQLSSGPGGIGILSDIFRGKKLLWEVLKINFENRKYS
jgi:hypothetical protein